MVRRILFDVLLFLLPFGVYGLYWRFSARTGERSAAHPWNYLLISGLVLVAASFVYWGVTEGAGQQGVYVPAHVENGHVIPGHVERLPAR
jgi:heme/copper-type cytochrome/quinol oxidase subunit 3